MALVASVGPGGAEVRMSHQRATHSQARHLPAHVAQAHIEGEYLPDGTDQRRNTFVPGRRNYRSTPQKPNFTDKPGELLLDVIVEGPHKLTVRPRCTHAVSPGCRIRPPGNLVGLETFTQT